MGKFTSVQFSSVRYVALYAPLLSDVKKPNTREVLKRICEYSFGHYKYKYC